MRWVCGALLAATGCSFSAPAPPSNGSDGNDAGVDSADPASCDWGFSPAHVDPCELDFGPAPSFESGKSYVLDTDEAVLSDQDGRRAVVALDEHGQGDGVVVAVWAVEEFDFTGVRLRVEGTRALLVASDSDMIIRGDLDLSGVASRQAGGADHVTACDGYAGSTGVVSGGGGGAGAGAPGAIGQTSAGGSGGDAGNMLSLLTVRGGCSGGAGGGGVAGGAGGGGLHLLARDEIRVDATIHAGGAGGDPGLEPGAGSGEGGGGGGSGGKIAFETPVVELSSVTRLIATGGGGGGGSSTSGTDGGPGQDAPVDGSPALGGTGGDAVTGGGGAGGDGGTGSTAPATTPGTASGGGGGGGGAAGRIIVRTGSLDDRASVIAPPLVVTDLE